MGDERLIIVDGYNVIHRDPRLAPGPERSLREAREKLVNLLSWAYGAGDGRFLVVFDGAEAGMGGRPGATERSGRVEVRFSKPPQSADDLIRALVEERVDREERVTVVTSDLEVARHARTAGADVSLADLFLASALAVTKGEASGEPEKPATLSKKELEEWAELFRSRRPKPPGEPDEQA